MTQVVAWLALVVAFIGAWYAKRSADASERSAKAADVSADVARADDRRARTPNLVVQIEKKTGGNEDAAIYTLRNDGPHDLDSVLVHRPEPENGIRYPIALVGTEYGDAAELGPLPLARTARFVLAVGTGYDLLTFRVRVVCRQGEDEWTLPIQLDGPRGGRVFVLD